MRREDGARRGGDTEEGAGEGGREQRRTCKSGKGESAKAMVTLGKRVRARGNTRTGASFLSYQGLRSAIGGECKG